VRRPQGDDRPDARADALALHRRARRVHHAVRHHRQLAAGELVAQVLDVRRETIARVREIAPPRAEPRHATVQPSRRKRRARIQRLAGGDARPCTSTTTRRRSAGGAATSSSPAARTASDRSVSRSTARPARRSRGRRRRRRPDARARRATRRAAQQLRRQRAGRRRRSQRRECAGAGVMRGGHRDASRLSRAPHHALLFPRCALRRDGSRRFLEGTSCRAPPAPPPSPGPTRRRVRRPSDRPCSSDSACSRGSSSASPSRRCACVPSSSSASASCRHRAP
jgi:hypothetical protein